MNEDKDQVIEASTSAGGPGSHDLAAPIQAVSSNGEKRTRAVTSGSGSNGPKTSAGKRRSSRNALKHGFFFQEFVTDHLLNDEERKKFVRIFEDLSKDYCPANQKELTLIELMALHVFQYRRFLRYEWASIRFREATGTRHESLEMSEDPNVQRGLEWQYELPQLSDLDKLQRCEAHILRNFYRALTELQRFQEIRLGKRVASRLTVDINRD